MCAIDKVHDRIWRFEIPLPRNALKALSCYVIKSQVESEKSLLIDIGFKLEECREVLFEAMNQLGLNKDNTDIFLTHSHADHSGNADYMSALGFNVLMGRYDYQSLQHRIHTSWKDLRERTILEGITNEFFDEVWSKNQGVICASGPFTAQTVENGEVLRYAGYELECIVTPGHTPGHTCLYDRKHKLLFSGDHLLWSISPNVLVTSEEENILKKYMNSLKLVSELDVELVFTSHRFFGALDHKARAEELIEHHQLRLEEIFRTVAANQGSSAFEIAAHITWGHGDIAWEDFTTALKWFAFGETLAHLDYLLYEGCIVKQMDESRNCYLYYVS